MSVVIDFGDKGSQWPSVQVATNRGWSDVADWANDLGNRANETYPNLMHLIDHGDCDELEGLVADIDGALAHDRPDDATVVKTLRGLRAAVKQSEDAPYVLVSDGFESGHDA